MARPSANVSTKEPSGRIAVLSVTEPFVTELRVALCDLVDVCPISTPAQLEQCLIENAGFDYMFVAHWRWLIPDRVLEKWRCIGFHTSRLPEGRGGSPIQNQILRGIYDSEVCAIKLERQLDAGDVYFRRSIDLREGNLKEILQRVARISAEMARQIIVEDPLPTPQAGEVSVFDRLGNDASELLLEGLSPRQVFDRIRMVDGFDYPRSFIRIRDWELTFSGAQISGDQVTASVTLRKIGFGELGE